MSARWFVVGWIVVTVAWMGFIDNQRIVMEKAYATCGKYRTT